MKLLFDASISIKPFMTIRENMLRVFFILLMIGYASCYYKFKPEDTSIYSTIITILATPVLVFMFYLKASGFLFKRNLFYLAYLLVSTGVYLGGMYLISQKINYNNYYVGFEFAHLLISSIGGFIVATVISFPFKVAHMVIFNTDLYYDEFMVNKLEQEAFPERKVEAVAKEKKRANISQYDSMNETQLQAELQLAIKEDRFEDAGKIKKILENKFR